MKSALPGSLVRTVPLALLLVFTSACDRAEEPPSPSLNARDLKLQAQYSSELSDTARADRWRTEHADWAAAKRQRHAQIEADIAARRKELEQLGRDAQRLDDEHTWRNMPAIVEVVKESRAVVVRNTSTKQISVAVAGVPLQRQPRQPGFCPLYPDGQELTRVEPYPIAPGASVRFLTNEWIAPCPKALDDTMGVALDIREGAALLWASREFLGRIVLESKYRLEQLERDTRHPFMRPLPLSGPE